jgi:hypothetical protein
MGYWKRQYTERPTGKPLFRPGQRPVEPSKTPETSDPAEPEPGAPAEPEQSDRQSTQAGTPGA